MQQLERLVLAKYLTGKGLTPIEIKTAIELTEMNPLSQENWNEIMEFIK